MRRIFLIIISVLFVFLQLTFLPRLAVFGVMPNLILAYVLVLAIDKGKSGWLEFFVPVLLSDILSSLPFGILTLSLWTVYSFISWLTGQLVKHNNFLSVLTSSSVGIFIYYFVWNGLLRLAGVFDLAAKRDYLSGAYFLTDLIISLVFGVLAVTIIFYPLKKYLRPVV